MVWQCKETVLVSPPAKWMHADIPYPPLGIAYLSAISNELGIETSVIDAQFPDYSSKMSELDKQQKTRLIGITSTLIQLPEAINIAKKVKVSNPNSVVVLGGAGPNCLAPEVLFQYSDDSVDLVCQGEGEMTWKEIVSRFVGSDNKNGELNKPQYLFENVQGTLIKDGSSYIQNHSRPQIENLDTIPMPDLKAIEAEKYIELWRKNGGMGSISIFPSRGCPFSCIFCDKTIFGKRFRHHSPGRIVDEMERIARDYKPIDDIFLFDDNLSTNREVMTNMCLEIERRNLKVNWSCQARVNTVDYELLKTMSRAGCGEIYFGVESASPHLLKYLGKNISPEQAIEAITLSRKAGMKPGCFLMVGVPGETKEDIDVLEKFIQQSQPSYVGFSVLIPFPGTELFERSKHLIKPELLGKYEDWDDTRKSIYKDGTFEVSPEKSISRLEESFKTMLSTTQTDYNPSQFVIHRYDEEPQEGGNT